MAPKDKQKKYRSWQRRCWLAATVLIAASVGPAAYCMGVIPGAEVVEEMTYGQCLAEHPLQFPTTIFVAGIMSVLAGFFFRALEIRDRADEEERKRRLDRAIKKAQIEDGVRRSSIDRRGLRGTGEPLPDAIDVDEGIEFGKDHSADDEASRDSVMAFVQDQDKKRAGSKLRAENSPGVGEDPRRPTDWFVPRGLEKAPALYVESGIDPVPVADPSRRTNNPNLPYVDLGEALRRAFQIVMDQGTQVVVRLKPGVYQTSVEIPDRVTLVNHRMPVDATVDQRLAWLREQIEVDHPERVTILAPTDSDFAVRAVPGRQQGIFGCYLVGRQGVAQTGLRLKNSKATSVVNCAFEAFTRSGVTVQGCGEAMAGRKVSFVGCVWRRNTSVDEGGALAIADSHVKVSASIFDSNRAPRGGAISARELEKPMILERSLLQRNRALADEVPPALDAMNLSKWRGIDGVGGALLVEAGLAKVEDTIIEGNDAAMGGGAIAALGARVVIKSTEPDRGVCKENRAGAGGGILAVGWADKPAMIRVKGADLSKNLATGLGGGGAVAGNGVIDLDEVSVDTNRANAGKRGVGGGLAAWKAGSIKIDGGEVVSNMSSGGGGGLAVINGSLKISGQTRINRNQAGGGGGGLMALTAPDKELERLVGQKGFELPFKIKLAEVRISMNEAAQSGGGLLAGNALREATFPLAILVRHPEWIVQNQTSGGERNSHQIWISWASRLEANDDRRSKIKLVLK